MGTALTKLLAENPAIWQGKQQPFGEATHPAISTGYTELDENLPGGGWPAASLIELIVPGQGHGELQLLLPTMVRFSTLGQWIVWIAPPYIPYAPALVSAGVALTQCVVIKAGTAQEAAWAMEKVLRSPECGMALCWLDRGWLERGWLDTGKKTLAPQAIRRLQLAASTGDSLGVMFRKTARSISPVALRLSVAQTEEGLRVQILKARGSHARPSVLLRRLV